jgi:DNA polymerase-3 subunit delta'
VERGEHPDVVEFEPIGNEVVLDEARAIIRETHASPVELDHKVVVLFGADRLRDEAANAMLKTLEEPPARTSVILVAERASAILATIRSRCQRVDFESLDEATILRALTASHPALPEERRELIARLAGGRLDRARLLAGRLGPLRDAFLDAVDAIDGTGASVERSVEMLVDVLGATVSELEDRQAEELEALAASMEAAGYPSRVAAARTRALAARQKREHRRARSDAWIEGFTAIESVYRDALAGPEARRINLDRTAPTVHARGAVAALEACRSARAGLIEFNANETLTLERLLLHLPAPGAVGRPPR